MSEYAQATARMLDMLPSEKQALAYEFIKRMVLEWDPDFTKLTAEEEEALKLAESDTEYYTLDEIMTELAAKAE